MFLQALRSKIIISLAMILIFAGTAFAQKKNQTIPWFFIQLTDPQFGMFDCNVSFEKETILYEKAVAKINSLNPDFVVITGDLAPSGIRIVKIYSDKIEHEYFGLEELPDSVVF